MSDRLDGKFAGEVYRILNGEKIPEDQFMVFLAKDNALPATLHFYRHECERIGAEQEQLEAVDRLLARVIAWRDKNPDKLKIPDAAPGECP